MWTCSPPKTARAGPRSCASLVARGLSGVQLVISDAHEGLKNAIAGVLPAARRGSVVARTSCATS